MGQKTMRAVVMHEFGGPEKLRLEEVKAPEPSALRQREVLIQVRAVGVCYHDIINRSGNLPRTRLPSILGHEIAGEVVAIGQGVQDFRPGDRVATVQRVHCGRCDLCRRGRPRLCQEGVFVGLHAIQVCRLIGARVLAVTSSANKVERLKEAGADETIVAPNLMFAEAARRLTGGRGVDVVLEITGALTFDQAMRSLAPAGRLIMVGNLETKPASFNPGLVILKELEIRGSFATTPPELSDPFRLVPGR